MRGSTIKGAVRFITVLGAMMVATSIATPTAFANHRHPGKGNGNGDGAQQRFYNSIERDINIQSELQNLRIMLYRSYLPSSQPDRFTSVPLPILTSVLPDGTKVKHPTCPTADGMLIRDLDYREIIQHLASGSDNVGKFFRLLAEAIEMNQAPVFPYCGWWTVISSDHLNIVFPDQTAAYWMTPLFASEKGKLQINGVYPDNRYMSLFVYNENWNFYTFEGNNANVRSWLTDFQIVPKSGSKNPWIERVPVRDLPGGKWRITLKNLGKNFTPKDDKNILPWFGTAGSGPDNEHGPTGEGATGQNNGSFPIPAPCGLSGLIVNSLVPCPPVGLFLAPPPEVQSGVVSNFDNTYIPALTNYFVPFLARTNRDIFYVIRGKLPNTPDGNHPVVWNDSNRDFKNYDMRYFSLCNSIMVRPYPAITNLFQPGNTVGCAYDSEITTDDEGYYAIISAPNSVIRKLGGRQVVENMQGGTNIIRALRVPRQLVLVRTMMPVNDFPHPGQKVPKDGSWQSTANVMQEYTPVNTGPCSVAFWKAENKLTSKETYGPINGWRNCIAPFGGDVKPANPICSPPSECEIIPD